MAVTTSIVINYGSVDDTFLVAELDSDLNGGRSSFSIGDAVYFRIYSVGSYSVECSDGFVNEFSSGTELIENEIISFPYSKTASTAKKVSSINYSEWLGNDLGVVSIAGTNTPTTLSASYGSETTLGVLRFSYYTNYDIWRLDFPGEVSDTSYSILIGIKALWK